MYGPKTLLRITLEMFDFYKIFEKKVVGDILIIISQSTIFQYILFPATLRENS